MGSGSIWTFRTPYKNSLQGETLARYASAHNLLRVAILRENEEYGRGLAEVFKEAATALGVEIVEERSFDSSTVDFRSLWLAINAKAPDAVLLAGFYPQLQVAAVQARETGIDAIFLAGDGVGSSEEFIKNAGAASEGTVVTGPFVVEGDRAEIKQFRQQFQERFGLKPDSWAVYAYDAVGIADYVLAKVGPDRTLVRKALTEIDSPEKAYSGLVGKIWFDRNGDAVNRDVSLAIVENGRYEVLLDATASPPPPRSK